MHDPKWSKQTCMPRSKANEHAYLETMQSKANEHPCPKTMQDKANELTCPKTVHSKTNVVIFPQEMKQSKLETEQINSFFLAHTPRLSETKQTKSTVKQSTKIVFSPKKMSRSQHNCQYWRLPDVGSIKQCVVWRAGWWKGMGIINFGWMFSSTGTHSLLTDGTWRSLCGVFIWEFVSVCLAASVFWLLFFTASVCVINRSEDDSEEHLGEVQQRSANGHYGTLGSWQVHTDGHCGRIQVRAHW